MHIENRRAIVIIIAYLVIAMLLIWGLAFLSRSIAEQNIATQEKNSLKAFYLAEAGIEDVKKNLYAAFETYYNANGKTASLFAWFDTLPDALKYVPPSNEQLGDGTYTVTIAEINSVSDGRDVKLVSQGTISGVTRTITAMVRFALGQSQIFNYSYFINNLGWFWGGGITANGDVRANGNFDFQGNPEVNGDTYASGSISGTNKNDTLSQYDSQAPDEARPMNPTNPSDPDNTQYEAGYDGNSEDFANQNVLEMPYLGDLGTYKTLASAEGGTITQGVNTLVNAVYTGNGPDNIANTADDGCLVLIGTAANPIQINGPVVINKDVVIKGVVTGQGTIYAGRNVHIVGDLSYKNGPSWPKPDATPSATDTTNSTKDFLGLAAKGNVVVGNYTRNDWKTNVLPYLDPDFTDPYEVDATDADIGYVSYYQGGKPYFDGDYTDNDGGYKKANSGNGQVARKYYESSLSDTYINTLAGATAVSTIEAVSYNNHALAGKVGNFTVNGTIISRDEAIIYTGNISMNYDVRAWGGPEALDIFLPRELVLPQVLSWEE